MSFVQQLFATTNIEKLRELASRRVLRRALTGKDLVAIGLGTMIGGGIFTTIGPGVALAGPAIIISYLLAGVASFFAALAYAELGSMVPIAGSAYTYAYATLGKLVAWIIGFALLFEYGISAAPVAQQFSGAFQDLLREAFHYHVPAWMQQSQLVIRGSWTNPSHWDLAHSHYDVFGAVFVLLLSVLLSFGIRETASTNNVFVVLKIGALIVFVFAGLALFHPQNLHPFIPLGWGKLTPFSGGNGFGIVPGAALVFFSYIGFDTATTTAEECKNPQRDVPVGVLGSLLIGTVIYCAVAV
nr:amino acid permease [Candidatus Eremiobacteraeota bacterium]